MGLTTENGLLYRDGEELSAPEADAEARAAGFMYAEQLVRHLEDNYDPTPYCSICKARESKYCNCPPPADNE